MKDMNFETCAKLHWSLPTDIQEAGLLAWVNGLTGCPRAPVRELPISLKKLATEVGRHPSYLWRLGVVENCGESYGGGRKVYRASEVLVYLKSAECTRRREELRTARQPMNKTKKTV